MGSSVNGSDGESFVSRVGSYAFTDIGVGNSDRDLAGVRGGNGTGACSPTSTILRSNIVSVPWRFLFVFFPSGESCNPAS